MVSTLSAISVDWRYVSSPEEVNILLSDELSMTMAALKANPKVYWIWNHRRWCLENVPDGPGGENGDPLGWKKANWDKELSVVEKMLDADPRNCSLSVCIYSPVSYFFTAVLAWNYRRYVLSSMPVPRHQTSELAYTARKIESNFSNFSAWHQRSKVYMSLWESGTLDASKCKEEGELRSSR
jgi:geranylgeranyl transferase type-2 subunit alpha